MMKGLKELRNKLKEKKGFTLVEIVVVLVIIAILATLMMGALNGYINKAKEKEITANCRAIALAAQTVASEHYAKGDTTVNATHTVSGSPTGTPKEIADLSGIGSGKLSGATATVKIEDYKVAEAYYTDGGYTGKYDPAAGTITVTKAAAD